MDLRNTHAARVAAVEVAHERQLEVLSRYFGPLDTKIEGSAYALMRRIAPGFGHSEWKMYELSNDTVYLAPNVPALAVRIDRTSFLGEFSGDAAGIVVTLLVLRGTYRVFGEESILTYFIRLREFARSHAEGKAILAATD